MNTDLEDALHTLDGPTLDRPADAILARGDHMRHRRRTSTAIVGAVGVAALAAAAYVVVPEVVGESSPPIATAPPAPGRIAPTATVDWSGGPTNLSADELDQLSDSCLTSAYATEPLSRTSTATGEIPAGTHPTVAERRETGIEALFIGNGHLVTCSTPGGMPVGHRFEATEASGRTFAMSEHAADKWPETVSWGLDTGTTMVLRVPDEVASVEVTLGEKTFPAVIVDDAAVTWLGPGEVTDEELHRGDSRAYAWHAYDTDGDPVQVPLSKD
ncbi:hypothetical protein G5C66_24375 [Nocardioides sp. KC13]|uniref:Uncharacterized protein n=1 Tax=Nocardioides turkmenicus TaxID=2711220 RepID=A0A6M1R8F5_9ACTN|nr:hypothetical protein [Nocardioides sp. KC13]NGN95862.1 hypothetical protein [Nocardioides sp. KC13]